MQQIHYREVNEADIPALAKIRAAEWETEAFWDARISGYLSGEHNPQKALATRIIFVAEDAGVITGFIAGHLTKCFACDGELEWINVINTYRGKGIALALLRLLATWFVQQNALKVCVDPDEAARNFYIKYGAENLNEHWLV